MKKIIISLVIIGVVAGITLGITGAWWTDQGVSQNQSFVSGNLNLRLSNSPTSGYGDNVSNTWNVDKMVPGGTPYVSTLYMKNTGSVDADYLKFTLKNYPSISGMDGIMRITELSYAGRNLLTGGAGANIPDYETPSSCNIEVNFGNDNYDAISAAVDAASEGQVICVGPGNYNSNWETTHGSGFPIEIDTKNVTLVSTDGPASTTIDAGGASRAVDIEADGVIVEGFTIKNAGDRAIGSYHATGVVKDVTIRNCKVTDNKYGIFIHHSTANNWTIENCECTDNDYYGLRADSGAVVNGLTVTNSKFSGNGGGGMISYANLDGLTVSGSTFTDNGFGIMLGTEKLTSHYIKNVLVTGTIFDDNNALGFWVYVYGFTGHIIKNIDVHNCSITNHDNYGVGFSDSGLAGYKYVSIDATNNWWGDFNPSDQVTGNVDYTPYAGGPFIGFINGQDLWANGFADLEDFERSIIVVGNPDLLPDSGSYHTLKMGVQLDGPTTVNKYMGGNVGMDMTVTMGQGPAE